MAPLDPPLAVTKSQVLFVVVDCNGRLIFHRRVWYRALSLCCACIRSSGIILAP